MMNRRAFFAALAGGLAAAADPDRLLWVPGRKLISIPKRFTLAEDPFVLLTQNILDLATYEVNYGIERWRDYLSEPTLTPWCPYVALPGQHYHRARIE